MSLDYLTLAEVKAILLSAFRNVLPEVDPTIVGWSKAFLTSNAAAHISLQDRIKDLEKQLFPLTAESDFLDIWGAYETLLRRPAAGSFGTLAQEGLVDTVIPVGTRYKSNNGYTYVANQESIINEQTIDVTSIIISGSIATATTDGDHFYGSGQIVTISNADPIEYNGIFEITVLTANTFIYFIDIPPIIPATGVSKSTSTFAKINIIAEEETGIATNIERGALLSLVNTVIGISDPAVVNYDQISGGADTETDEDYRGRILLSRSAVSGVFTSEQVELAALSIPGNTRAYVIPPELSTCTGSPNPPTPGQVAIYPLRDNDPSIIPSQSILNATKNVIIAFGRLPCHTSEADVLVLAAKLVPTNFDFLTITPDTPTMRKAVGDQLLAFFEDSVGFGTTIQSDAYRGAIQNTYDLTGDVALTTFDLISPTTDIEIEAGELATLGVVTFA